jgi:hypothetical protein
LAALGADWRDVRGLTLPPGLPEVPPMACRQGGEYVALSLPCATPKVVAYLHATTSAGAEPWWLLRRGRPARRPDRDPGKIPKLTS